MRRCKPRWQAGSRAARWMCRRPVPRCSVPQPPPYLTQPACSTLQRCVVGCGVLRLEGAVDHLCARLPVGAGRQGPPVGRGQPGGVDAVVRLGQKLPGHIHQHGLHIGVLGRQARPTPCHILVGAGGGRTACLSCGHRAACAGVHDAGQVVACGHRGAPGLWPSDGGCAAGQDAGADGSARGSLRNGRA